MSVQFPAELGWLFPSVVGENWPSGDEDLLRECADAWRRAGTAVREEEEAAWQLTRRVAGTMEGSAAEVSTAAIEGLVTGDEQSLRELSSTCVRLADACEAYAASIERTKRAIIEQIAPVGNAIQTAVSLAKHTEGLSLADVAGQLAEARGQVRATFHGLLGEADQASTALRDVAAFEDVRVATEAVGPDATAATGRPQALSISEGDPLRGEAAVPQVPGVTPASVPAAEVPPVPPGQPPFAEAVEEIPGLAELLRNGELTDGELAEVGAGAGESPGAGDDYGPAGTPDGPVEDLADDVRGATEAASAPPPAGGVAQPPPPPPAGAVSAALEGGGHSGGSGGGYPGGSTGGPAGGSTVTPPRSPSSPSPVSTAPAGGGTRLAGGSTPPAGSGGLAGSGGGAGSASGGSPRPGAPAPGAPGGSAGGGSAGGGYGGGYGGGPAPGGAAGGGGTGPPGGAVPPSGSGGSVVVNPGSSGGAATGSGPPPGPGGAGVRPGDAAASTTHHRAGDAPGRTGVDQPPPRGREVGGDSGYTPARRTLPAPDSGAPLPDDPTRARAAGRRPPLFMLATGVVHRPEYDEERRRERRVPTGPPERRFQQEFSREDFHRAGRRPVEELSDHELASLAWLHCSVVLGETTTMQKIITPWQAECCLTGKDRGIGGFVVRWDDVAGCRTPAELQECFGYGYREPDGKRPFAPTDPETHLLRFPAVDPEAYKRPFGGRNPAYAELYRERWGLRTLDEVEIWSYPFTGTGFTGSQRRVVPAFVLKEDLPVPNGAEMYRLTADRAEALTAVHVTGLGWVRVVDDGPAMEAR